VRSADQFLLASRGDRRIMQKAKSAKGIGEVVVEEGRRLAKGDRKEGE
jgi:hypothetical protein